MKTIGVILRKLDENNKINYIISNSILEYINYNNINILGIIINENINYEYIKYSINLCDGIILPGGNYIDEKNIKLVKYLYDIDKPTLGICLGMQQMSLAFNGNLLKLENNKHLSNIKYVHKINIKKNTYLFNILKKDTILVNSRHSFKVDNTKLDISAISDDNIIEAVEDKNKKFFIGIQFHPEDIKNDINSKKIIEEFIKKL